MRLRVRCLGLELSLQARNICDKIAAYSIPQGEIDMDRADTLVRPLSPLLRSHGQLIVAAWNIQYVSASPWVKKRYAISPSTCRAICHGISLWVYCNFKRRQAKLLAQPTVDSTKGKYCGPKLAIRSSSRFRCMPLDPQSVYELWLAVSKL